MEELVRILKELLASTVALKYKAHGYHWNVETDDFPQYHEFFGKIYEDYDGAIDPMAEWIRMIDINSYAPFKLSRFAELSIIPETEVSANHEDMAKDLKMSNDLLIPKFIAAGELATNMKQFGLANFFADRQTMHQKWSWQLGTLFRSDPEETPQQGM
jgi:starvation-inducible DNA-binding protein